MRAVYKHLRADIRQRAWRIRVIVERQTGVVVGSVNMKGPPDEGGDVEIGWGVSEDRRRRGYAFEATAAVIGWAERQPGVESFSATIPETNLVSQRLARKLGMTMTSHSRRDLPLWKRPANLGMEPRRCRAAAEPERYAANWSADMFSESAEFYDAIYSFKDYAAEDAKPSNKEFGGNRNGTASHPRSSDTFRRYEIHRDLGGVDRGPRHRARTGTASGGHA
jgi:hypothetical protein